MENRSDSGLIDCLTPIKKLFFFAFAHCPSRCLVHLSQYHFSLCYSRKICTIQYFKIRVRLFWAVTCHLRPFPVHGGRSKQVSLCMILCSSCWNGKSNTSCERACDCSKQPAFLGIYFTKLTNLAKLSNVHSSVYLGILHPDVLCK